MKAKLESVIRGRGPAVPEWNVIDAEVDAERIVARFHDGCSTVTTREAVVNGMPERYGAALRDPHEFARGHYSEDFGTVVWPNGADISPEFLRWGPHTGADCACGLERRAEEQASSS